jgi:hypothetical protein
VRVEPLSRSRKRWPRSGRWGPGGRPGRTAPGSPASADCRPRRRCKRNDPPCCRPSSSTGRAPGSESRQASAHLPCQGAKSGYAGARPPRDGPSRRRVSSVASCHSPNQPLNPSPKLIVSPLPTRPRRRLSRANVGCTERWLAIAFPGSSSTVGVSHAESSCPTGIPSSERNLSLRPQ